MKPVKRTDIRTYPLGGVENFMNSLAKYFKVPKNMISVGNGSDQILDLILSKSLYKVNKNLNI